MNIILNNSIVNQIEHERMKNQIFGRPVKKIQYIVKYQSLK
jgi:hypothetical protein